MPAAAVSTCLSADLGLELLEPKRPVLRRQCPQYVVVLSPAFVQPRLGEKRSERVVDVLDQQLVVAAVVVPPA